MFRWFRRRRRPPAPPVSRPPRAPWRSPDPALSHELADHLHPELQDALDHGDPARVAQPAGPGLWRVPFFDTAGIARLVAVTEHRLRWQDGQHEPPNSMHYAGMTLEPLSLGPAITTLRRRALEPLRAVLYPELDVLDEDHAFIAAYGRGLDTHLGFHVDDSELTLNVCLGLDFEGGAVEFLGRRCPHHRQTDHRPDEEALVDLLPGQALLHAGAHRHLVRSVHGERRNLIVWSRSSAFRAAENSECPPWCGHS